MLGNAILNLSKKLTKKVYQNPFDAELIRSVTGVGHSPMLTTYGLSGNKNMTERKKGKSRTKPNSRVQSKTSKKPAGA